MEGWVYKEGGFTKGWKKRWLKFDGDRGELVYAGKKGGTPKGHIDIMKGLQGIEIISGGSYKGKKNVFKLTSKDCHSSSGKKRDYFISCGSLDETNQWVSVVKGFSSQQGSSVDVSGGFFAIPDNFHSLSDIQDALRKGGLESSNLIVGIDYTKSNTWNGERTFGNRCLHALDSGGMNPYQEVMDIVGRTLEPFDDDRLIPTFGFGDSTTKDKTVFPVFPDGRPCNGVIEVLSRYTEITPGVQLSGPTSFGPLIQEAIAIVKREELSYHILIIIADGEVTSKKATADAIIEASGYPLSIIMIGVGDGPFDTMKEFDDELPSRK